MPTLGNALDFVQLEAKSMRIHQLGTAPTVPAPVKGQMYFNTADNTLYWYNGTIWVSASGGAPSGAAGGDLSGTYPNPQIAAGAIVDADVSNTAAIQTTKLTPNPLARANHTGTQTASTISDFTTVRDQQRLDQHAVPTAAVNLNSQKITNLLDPTGPQDGASKNYVDAVAQGVSAKQPCHMASIGNVVIPGAITSYSIDGVALSNNDRVLLKNQTDTTKNGIYVWAGGVGLARAADLDSAPEFPNAYVWVMEGTQADTAWVCTNDASFILDTTGVTWVQFAAAGAAIAGAGLTKTGNTFDIGAGAGITVAADSISIGTDAITNVMLAPNAVDLDGTDVTGTLAVTNGGTNSATAAGARSALSASGYYSSATHGAGTSIIITAATHGLGAKRGLIVQVQEEATGNIVLPDVTVAATGDVTVTFGVSVVANAYRVTVLG